MQQANLKVGDKVVITIGSCSLGKRGEVLKLDKPHFDKDGKSLRPRIAGWVAPYAPAKGSVDSDSDLAKENAELKKQIAALTKENKTLVANTTK